MNIELSRRDIGRLLSLVAERRRKLERGVAKFGTDFDPTKGANIADGLVAFRALEQVLKEAMDHDDNHPRQPPAHRDEREGRRQPAGLHRQD